MKTFKIKYFIIPKCLRTVEKTASNYNNCRKEFLKSSGLRKENILKIVLCQ